MSIPAHHAEALIEKIQSLPVERVAEVEDFVDFLKERTRFRKDSLSKKSSDFPVISVGQWPDDLNLDREAMYGDDGR